MAYLIDNYVYDVGQWYDFKILVDRKGCVFIGYRPLGDLSGLRR